MEITESIYQTAQTCKIYVQKFATLLFQLLMVILKALKSSDFFFNAIVVFAILNSFNPVLIHHHNYSL